MKTIINILLKIGAGIAFVVSIFLIGKKQAEDEAKIEELQDEQETQKRIDDASVPTTRDDAERMLRKHGQFRD